MVQEYSHLFFSYFKLKENDEEQKAKEISLKQEILLKQLKQNGYDIGTLLEDLKTKKLFMQSYDTIIIFSDGGVRNNHDVDQTSMAASAFSVYGDQKMLKHNATFIGDTIQTPNGEITNINSTLAEYHGLLNALLYVEKYNITAKKVVFLTDCASMVQHLTKKLPHQSIFRKYALVLKEKLLNIPNVELKHIPREYNKITDALVNQLLDEYERSGKCVVNN